jgi:hypothetical protein
VNTPNSAACRAAELTTPANNATVLARSRQTCCRRLFFSLLRPPHSPPPASRRAPPLNYPHDHPPHRQPRIVAMMLVMAYMLIPSACIACHIPLAMAAASGTGTPATSASPHQDYTGTRARLMSVGLIAACISTNTPRAREHFGQHACISHASGRSGIAEEWHSEIPRQRAMASGFWTISSRNPSAMDWLRHQQVTGAHRYRDCYPDPSPIDMEA